jgi:enolase-like protein
MREAIGPGIEIFVDAHGRFDVATAIRLANRLAPCRIGWFEEAVPPENWDAIEQFRARSDGRKRCSVRRTSSGWRLPTPSWRCTKRCLNRHSMCGRVLLPFGPAGPGTRVARGLHGEGRSLIDPMFTECAPRREHAPRSLQRCQAGWPRHQDRCRALAQRDG